MTRLQTLIQNIDNQSVEERLGFQPTQALFKRPSLIDLDGSWENVCVMDMRGAGAGEELGEMGVSKRVLGDILTRCDF